MSAAELVRDRRADVDAEIARLPKEERLLAFDTARLLEAGIPPDGLAHGFREMAERLLRALDADSLERYFAESTYAHAADLQQPQAEVDSSTCA